jgi:hypothetical protein
LTSSRDCLISNVPVAPINTMSDSRALRIVAVLFFITGISSVVEFFCSFGQHRFLIPWGILGFFVCYFLPAYRRGWRTVGLVLLWIALIVLPVIFVFNIFSNPAATVYYITLLGFDLLRVPLWIFLPWLAACWLLNFWQYRVLTRPSVRAAFLDTPATA